MEIKILILNSIILFILFYRFIIIPILINKMKAQMTL